MVPGTHAENTPPIKRLNAPPLASPAVELAGCTFLKMPVVLLLDAAATAAEGITSRQQQRRARKPSM
jgi:hypothetical protein